MTEGLPSSLLFLVVDYLQSYRRVKSHPHKAFLTTIQEIGIVLSRKPRRVMVELCGNHHTCHIQQNVPSQSHGNKIVAYPSSNGCRQACPSPALKPRALLDRGCICSPTEASLETKRIHKHDSTTRGKRGDHHTSRTRTRLPQRAPLTNRIESKRLLRAGVSSNFPLRAVKSARGRGGKRPAFLPSTLCGRRSLKTDDISQVGVLSSPGLAYLLVSLDIIGESVSCRLYQRPQPGQLRHDL